MRTKKPVTATLRAQQASLDQRLESGEYSSASKIVRAAPRDRDPEAAIPEAALRERVRVSLADRQTTRPAEDVFARLRMHHAERVKAETRDS